MKSINNKISFIGITILISIGIFVLLKNMVLIKNLHRENLIISDSKNKSEFENHYMSKLIEINLLNRDKKLPEQLYAFEMSDTNKQFPISLDSILAKGKDNLIIRYTEIGCNSCTDSTFKYIRNNQSFLSKYNILVLVDFNKYEYYVKWMKISEIEEKVLWLERGSLPFSIEKENSSYLFIVNKSKIASSFFIPNYLLTSFLKDYISSL